MLDFSPGGRQRTTRVTTMPVQLGSRARPQSIYRGSGHSCEQQQCRPGQPEGPGLPWNGKYPLSLRKQEVCSAVVTGQAMLDVLTPTPALTP